LDPVTSCDPVSVSEATPLAPEGCTVTSPSDVPLMKNSKPPPAGMEPPLVDLTVTESNVLPVVEMDVGLAVSVVVVPFEVTVTGSDATDVLKTPAATNPAVIVLLPTLRLLPAIVAVAAALVPAVATAAAEPIVLPARVNVKVPEGVVVPLAGVTVAVN